MRQISVIAIALVLAIPAATATWFSAGTYEPDTIFDQNGPMWKEANATLGSKNVYFNVYQTSAFSGASINVGLLGSRHVQPGILNFNAIFGPWVDCNGDETVGFAEYGLLVYPSNLLTVLGDDICPVGSAQNDGTWVWEYIPIGYDRDEVPETLHTVQIRDTTSLVWGDIGFPGFAATASCPISPLPHGTTSGTGWLLRYTDCFAGYRVQDTVTANDPTPGRVLAFDCPQGTQNCERNPQKSDSLLNQHFPESLFGNPEKGETGTLQLDSEEDGGPEESAFTTWDCSSRTVVDDRVDAEESFVLPTGNSEAETRNAKITVGTKRVIVEDPTFDGENGQISGNYGKDDVNFTEEGEGDEYAWVARPAPAVHDPADSVADGLNGTFRGFRVGGGDETYDMTVGGDCDTARDADVDGEARDGEDGENTYSFVHTTAFFRADAPFEPPSATGKKEQDEMFVYFNGQEVEGTDRERFGPNYPGNPWGSTYSGYGCGMWELGISGCDNVPGWRANTLWASVPQSINRNTLQPTGPVYWTFYARADTLTTLGTLGYKAPPLNGASGVYGSEACNGAKSGVHNGWDCDSTHWYTDASFQPIVDGNEIWQARAGDPYQFRDVDCLDGSVARGAGVFASLTQLSPGVDEDRDPSTPNTFVCQDAPL